MKMGSVVKHPPAALNQSPRVLAAVRAAMRLAKARKFKMAGMCVASLERVSDAEAAAAMHLFLAALWELPEVQADFDRWSRERLGA